MSDKQKILSWFEDHRYLTCMDAIHKLKVYNLRSRACEIPGISSKRIDVVREDGKKVQVAQYSLEASQQ